MNDSATWTPSPPTPGWPSLGAGLTAFAGPTLVNAYPHLDAAQQALADAEPQAWWGSGAAQYTSLRTIDLAQVQSLRTAVEAAEAALVLYLQTREFMANALCPAPGGTGLVGLAGSGSTGLGSTGSGSTGLGSTTVPYGAARLSALSNGTGRKALS